MVKRNILIGAFILIVVGTGIFILSSKGQQKIRSKTAAKIQRDNEIYATKQKPRDKIITYRAEKGDTVTSIAEKFDITVDTIKWANGLKDNAISPGQELRILPVSGVAHTVEKGDTVDTLASKYHTTVQAIISYPFNHFANQNTFTLVEGNEIIIPGAKP